MSPSDVRPRLRLWPWLTPGLARELLKQTACKLPDGAPFIVSQVDYRPTGTIRNGVVEGTDLSEGCRRAGRVLAALTIAAPHRAIVADQKEIVVIPFERDYLDCLEGEVKPGRRRGRTEPVYVESGEVLVPQKRRNVAPVYPPAAIERRVQGTVVLEATITTEGCVQDLDVLSSVHPLLDFAALRAVMLWRYAPGILNGEPVPVIMTVTSNFALQY